MALFPIYEGSVPAVTTAQMIEVDRAMIEDYGITLAQMMENAGQALARLARARFLHGDTTNKVVVVLAGSGGNGGGALAAARRLHNYGAAVQVYLARPAGQTSGTPAQQLDILKRMGVQASFVDSIQSASPPDLILDGIIGYSLRGAPRGAAAGLIHWANAQRAPILALDVPSGIESTYGTVFDPAIRAAATLALALPKSCHYAAAANEHIGELYLADISVPPELYTKPPLELTVGHLFARGEIIRLR